MTEPTSGPWQFDHIDGFSVYVPLPETARDGATIDLIATVEAGEREQRKANARLIAAAPELLACLRGLEHVFVTAALKYREGTPEYEDTRSRWWEVQRAIAEATGEAWTPAEALGS